jgi:hypothetical protein
MGDLDRVWRIVLRVSAVLAVIAGGLLFAGAEETEDWFSWTIQPPMTAAFLGAVYWAAAILFWTTSRRAGWAALKVAAVPEAVAATGLLIATAIHLDRFHHDLFGYFWITVYALAAPLLVLLTLALRRRDRGEPAGAPALPAPLRALVGAEALVLGAYGLALFVLPGTFDAAWPWQLTPLTGRATGSFLVGIALAVAVAGPRAPLGAPLAFAALGALEILAAFLHGPDFTSRPARVAFAAFFAAVAVAGIAGARALSAQAPTSASASSAS